MGQIEHRLEEFARCIQSDEDAAALRLHVNGLLESPSFNASRRSGQFLHYIVDKAIAQEADALKERTIGVEIFHRSPDYDTGEDAVVRVTASEVRRRLAQHYSQQGRGAEFLISLPPGAYVPELLRTAVPEPPHEAARIADTPPLSAEELPRFVQPAAEAPGRPRFRTRTAVTTFAVLAFVALLGWAGMARARSRASAQQGPSPWGMMFQSGRPLYLVLSDPDLNEIQLLTGKPVPVSDYVNGKLGCDTLQQSLRQVCATSLRGDKVAAVDAMAIARIAALAASYGTSLEPHTAREIRLTDIQGDRDVVFLGSRRANPWTDLFRDKLDLSVAYDEARGLQVVHNARRLAGEQEWYVPTAGPQGTGDNYTLISFLPNLSGSGHALLLGGATHEGTDEAVAIVTDKQRFKSVLQECRLSHNSSAFQMLLRLRMMGGSTLSSQVVTCHAL